MSAILLNADLHSHSTVSDGVLTPSDLAIRAKRNGVELWALTDHDEVSGVAEARVAAADLRLPFVAGVEVSVTWAGKTVHIVGLQVDETNPQLLAGLANTRSGRERRARDMAQDLQQRAGIAGVYEGALKYVGNPDLISRSHFARYLAEIGAASSVSDAFKHFLTEGKPGYVPHRWASLKDAVSWIREAGGVAVIAHPGRYELTPLAFDCFFREFKAFGGVAIETVTGSHTVDQYAEYAGIAARYGFLSSRGSDFHSPEDFEVDIGQLQALPRDSVPVWAHWRFD
ncbi:3',5'-nucleoside bisphosphate phosphatase [Undibacterium rugosum]|uniref:3',5'-nucleoside bisphosphate phosphatase n=1 Tax=Undibacterium rugosum TaxID=2762291 RepID=UPI001B83D431|nr:3',5'-nucleoside bisphosphate phosphatase [Undibacterium rugosum]MBR7778877.1 PHP domain-containing protein [Undibacterium rugosum]